LAYLAVVGLSRSFATALLDVETSLPQPAKTNIAATAVNLRTCLPLKNKARILSPYQSDRGMTLWHHLASLDPDS
jgi:hypothetical protein